MQKRTRSSLRAAVVTLVAGLLTPAGAQAQEQAAAQEQEQAQEQEAAQEQEQLQEQVQEHVQEQEPPETSDLNPAAAAFDVLIVRPFGLAVVPVGVAAFLPAALLTAPGGKDSILAALDYFVTGPTNFVFQRKLGDF